MKYLTLLILSFIPLFNFGQDTTMFKGELQTRDAWIWSAPNFKTLNFGESSTQNQGLNNVIRSEAWDWVGRDDTIRGLVRFDFTGFGNPVILEARMNLYYFSNPNFTQQVGQNQLLIRRITQNWVEDQVNWANQPATTNQNEVELPAAATATQDYLNIDVTDLIKDMVAHGNEGFMLQMKTESPFRGLTFASSEHVNSQLHPELVLITESSTGIDPRATPTLNVRTFPNPSSGDFTLVTSVPLHSLALVDALGREEVLPFQPQATEQQIHLDTKPSAGVYWIKVGTAQGHKVVPLVIKE